MIDRESLLEESEVNVRVAAAQVSRRFKGVVTYADLVQEGKLWVWTHPSTVRARLDDGKRGDQRLTDMVAKHLQGIARREKASLGGYQTDDEAFYNRTVIEAALPAVWDEAYLLKPPPSEEDAGFTSTKADPSESGTWQAIVMDVRRAWEEADMTTQERVALAYRYGHGFKIYQIAGLLECADSTAHGYIQSGLRRMVDVLGGDPPAKCPPDCECGQGPGNRRAISNAQARALTDGQYDE